MKLSFNATNNVQDALTSDFGGKKFESENETEFPRQNPITKHNTTQEHRGNEKKAVERRRNLH